MTLQPNTLALTADFEFAALNEAKNYRTALLRDFGEFLQGNVLEVGAGIGQLTSELRAMPRIQKITCVEPDAAFCNQVRSRFPDTDLLEGTVSDLKSELAWNAILSVNVLEHIENDGKELVAYHQLLKTAKGALCLFVPARPEIYAPIDKDFGHFRRYKRAELRRKLELAGFRPVQIRYYNFAGYFLWWLNFGVLKRRTFDAAAVRLFDRVIFPIVHGFESRICAPIIGQSLMVIAIAD